jgi:putative hydrolase of the HAD superfamily
MGNIDWSRVKGVIFDYGGTLDTRGDHWSHVIRDAWREAGVSTADEEKFRDSYVFAERALARERIIEPNDDFGALMKKKLVIELTRFSELGGIDSADIEAAADKAAKYCDDFARSCVRETWPVLKSLSEQYPMVLVSNFYGNVDSVIREYGIRGYFNGIIESAVVGVRKPDPRIFRLGTVALDLDPENVLVVGDSLRKDILPARSIGCQTAWIKGRGWTPDEDAAQDAAQIPNLSSLLQR